MSSETIMSSYSPDSPSERPQHNFPQERTLVQSEVVCKQIRQQTIDAPILEIREFIAGIIIVQFCISVDRIEILPATGNTIGLDVGLASFYTDSNGLEVKNPKFYRTGETVWASSFS
jgi:hypothetical protein